MLVKLWSDGAFCGIKSELVVKVDDDADLDQLAKEYMYETLSPEYGHEEIDEEDFDEDEYEFEDWT